MAEPLNILLIAPHAPPKNTAEAIQVLRVLKELDKHARGRLVKIIPNSTSSWEIYDPSLEITLDHFDTQLLSLPWHRVTSALLMSHRMARFHIPDSAMWIQWMASNVTRKLTQKYDLIYSRSSPMSGALLAARLKKKLGIPWVMHLSDPWADSLYKSFNPLDARYEAECFEAADLTALTTPGQAEFYCAKYPHIAERIFVSPNVMPERVDRPSSLAQDGRLHIVFAGRLYGTRSPRPLIDAIDILRRTDPHVITQLRIDLYGNIQADSLEMVQRASDVLHYHGHVDFAVANEAQHAADLVLAIEPDSDHPLILGTLLSKITDCMAQGQKLFAITPPGSETERLCNAGYGWAVSPSDPQAIANALAECVRNVFQVRYGTPRSPALEYSVEPVVVDLLNRMNQLLKREAA